MTRNTDKDRVRQAKGSVQAAIGKIIGDTAIERQGRRKSRTVARRADADPPIDKGDGD